MVQLTLGLTIFSLAMSVVMTAIIVERHVHRARGHRRREQLGEQFEPARAPVRGYWFLPPEVVNELSGSTRVA
jgi:hypothetical protein